MAKKAARAKDKTRVTVRFQNEAVAEEFYQRAEEAGMRPSPFAAELIERALAEGDANEFEQHSLQRDINDLRDSLETLQQLPRELAENDTNNDDVLVELTALRREIGDVKESLAKSPEEPKKLLRKLEQLQTEMKELAELPHVFVKLREDVATGIRPLLVRTCGLAHDEAEEWIRKNILEE